MDMGHIYGFLIRMPLQFFILRDFEPYLLYLYYCRETKKGSDQAPSLLSANDAMRGITYCTDRRWMTDVQLNLLLFSSSALLHLGSGPCLRRGTRSGRTVCSHAPLHQQHDMPGIPILRIPVSRVGCWCKIKSCPGLINLACTLFVSPF